LEYRERNRVQIKVKKKEDRSKLILFVAMSWNESRIHSNVKNERDSYVDFRDITYYRLLFWAIDLNMKIAFLIVYAGEDGRHVAQDKRKHELNNVKFVHNVNIILT
jgi:hypothetical protein